MSDKPDFSKLISSRPSHAPSHSPGAGPAYQQSASPAAPRPTLSAASAEQKFHVWVDGHTYGPISLEELNGWFLQRRITAQTQVMTVGSQQWLPAGNFLTSVPQAAPYGNYRPTTPNPYADPSYQTGYPSGYQQGYTQHGHPAGYGPYGHNQQTSAHAASIINSTTTLVMISGILNMIIGLLLCLTCYGIVIGVPMLVLACCELNMQSQFRYMHPAAVRSQVQTLAIFEIICGLFNWFSLVLGIINLVQIGQLRQ